MHSNCLIEALREYRRRLRRWRQAGRPRGQEPYLLKRRSRHEPRWIHHYLVGRWRDCPHCGGGVQVESFKPDAPLDVPWWRAWSRLLFRGRWVAGDGHES